MQSTIGTQKTRLQSMHATSGDGTLLNISWPEEDPKRMSGRASILLIAGISGLFWTLIYTLWQAI